MYLFIQLKSTNVLNLGGSVGSFCSVERFDLLPKFFLLKNPNSGFINRVGGAAVTV